MGIVDGLRRQLRTVIQWEDPAGDQLFYRWSNNGDEIKNASQLIVGPGHGCIFVYRGQIKSIMEREGVFNLKTANIPFWTTISKFLQFFESEHKTGFYFYKRTKILDQKWGTTSPIKYLDPIYNFPVGLRSYGNFSFKIETPELFFTTVIGDNSSYAVADLRAVMTARLTQRLSDHLAEKRLSYLEIDASRNELAENMIEQLSTDFSRFGLAITDFRIEGLDYDDESRTRINRIGDVAADVYAAQSAGLSYEELQKLGALKDAALNEGGAAGIGMGMGAGMGLGQMMGSTMASTPTTVVPESPDSNEKEIMEKLTTLKKLFEHNLITEEEYKSKKQLLLTAL